MSNGTARAAPLTSALGRDATQYGVRPGSPDDQTKVLQRAIELCLILQRVRAEQHSAADRKVRALDIPSRGVNVLQQAQAAVMHCHAVSDEVVRVLH